MKFFYRSHEAYENKWHFVNGSYNKPLSRKQIARITEHVYPDYYSLNNSLGDDFPLLDSPNGKVVATLKTVVDGDQEIFLIVPA